MRKKKKIEQKVINIKEEYYPEMIGYYSSDDNEVQGIK